MNKLVLTIAKKVRKRCKAFALSKKAMGYDFHNEHDLSCMYEEIPTLKY